MGTRMLPVTKGLPKEMMPIGGKPLIQYAVEEAVASGIEEVVLITRDDKSVLDRYFARDPELEQFLQERGRQRELAGVRALSALVRITTVHQEAPRGLGDALRCARHAVGNQPFAVILPDALINATRPVLAQLLDVYRQHPGCYLATQPVDGQDVSRFGMLDVAAVEDGSAARRLFRVLGLVEKPLPGNAPSPYGVFGRYLLDPEVLDLLDHAAPDSNGEVQLSEALASYCRQKTLYALCFAGRHYDAGDKLGYLQAVVDFALTDPEVGSAFQTYLTRLGLNLGGTSNAGLSDPIHPPRHGSPIDQDAT